MNVEELLKTLHQKVAAEPVGSDGQRAPTQEDLLSHIQRLRGDTGAGLKRSQKRKLVELLREFPAADVNAARDLNRRLMAALPGSTRIVDALNADPARLAAAGVVKDEQIWARLGNNHNGELNALSGSLAVPPAKILEAISTSSLEHAARYDPSWLRSHALECAAVAVGVVFVISGAKALRGLPPFRAPEVVMARDVPAFEPITTTDVRVQIQGRKAGAFSQAADVIGRFAVAGFAKDTIPTAADLSVKKLAGSLQNRSILRVPLKIGNGPLPWQVPVRLTLVVAPKHAGTPPMLMKDTWILALQNSGDGTVAWVAIDSNGLAQIAALLGDAEVYPSQP